MPRLDSNIKRHELDMANDCVELASKWRIVVAGNFFDTAKLSQRHEHDRSCKGPEQYQA